MSDYFDASQNRLSDGARARAADVNGLRDEVGVGFDKLPTSEDFKDGKATYGVDSGAADAYVVAMTYPRLAYVVGMEIAFIPTNSSTGASTIDVDGIGAKNIKQPDDTEITEGVMQAGSVIVLRYNGTYFTIVGGGLLDSTAAAAASAQAAATSETNASASATAASNSAAAAATSETNAATSETNAAASEAAASLSETNAAASEAAVASTVADLASNDAGKGSGLIGRESGSGTVTGALNTIEADDWVTTARLADNLEVNADSVQFDLVAGVSVSEGQLAWNPNSKTLDLGMTGGDVVQQIGQELPSYVKNSSGAQIDNGSIAYISGASGANPLIKLADASAIGTSRMIGMATEDINNNEFGYVTTFGLVRSIDTSAFGVGDCVWLSDTTPGGLVATPPVGKFAVRIGTVIRSSATVGSIFIHPGAPLNDDSALTSESSQVTPTQSAVKGYVDSRNALMTTIINGLVLSNNSGDAINDLDITVGSAVDTTGAEFMILSSGLTKQLDAVWAEGTDAGGLDIGAKANATWYHVWLIYNPTSGVRDILFSTSATAPTMPTNYTLKRRLGSFYYIDGTDGIKPFYHSGDHFQLAEPSEAHSAAMPTTSTALTLLTPMGVAVIAKLSITGSSSAGGDTTHYVLVGHTDDTLVAGASAYSFSYFLDSGVFSNISGSVEALTDALSQIEWDSTQAASVNVSVHGWIDKRSD